MESRTFTVQQIFQDRRQYRVPFYQRPYVWNREDQWARLWDDIREKAESRLEDEKPVPHFMGAVVLEPQKKSGLIGVERHHIIDGQQRLTTLQYVLGALSHVLRGPGERLLPLAAACLTNTNPETMEDPAIERFKLWPTFRDRDQFEQAMTSPSIEALRDRFPTSFTQGGTLRKIGVNHPPALEAVLFFYEAMRAWSLEAGVESADRRVNALATAVLSDLSVVCISLGEDDDAQIIFETLNGHGAELHATDLIRNFIFMRAGANADDLYDTLWSQFESPLWSEPQSRGRLNRPRLEWFVQSAVQAQTGEEIDIGRLYAGYRRFVAKEAALHSADQQLQMLNLYAEHYKSLVKGLGEDPIAVFGRRISVWDASATHPIAIRVASSSLSPADKSRIYGAIESYLVRRAVCGLSKKNYNKVFSQQLKKLIDGGLTVDGFERALSAFTGEASRWPGDDEFRRHLLTGPMYPGRLDAAKLRAIFHRFEMELRTERTEERVPLQLEALDIDHILPQSWYAHWPLNGEQVTQSEAAAADMQRFAQEGRPAKVDAINEREDAVSRIGNLTFVHYGVNRSYSNYGFPKKREMLFEHSNLHLNRALMRHLDWDVDAIRARGEHLAGLAMKIWPGPVAV